MTNLVTQLASGLSQMDPSARLQTALTAGTYPDDAFLEVLVERCAIEPDFSVREMLTWALTRLSHDLVLERVIAELDSPIAQARSQALHTLSKLRDVRAWPAITMAHLHDTDDEVARTAWRTATGLAPLQEHDALAGELKHEFGRGDVDVQRSLARAMVDLGDSGEKATREALLAGAPRVRIHASATLRLIHDPEATFYLDPGDEL
ncbi:HEAT repeat domain-containing protein [Leucobacter denitrificans]|uniref:HEAT repeat domain-containing protein n=1 Tax=Leucobacter denitrificans TaxID=683042 RepID=A0A7G9S2E4_9MICO|nr:HEAT repeat domain-containing protein [Leucobacter denitrificans]QNN62019.1 HEAT repeat domain-containing protein [Leucobacter denitrificans]